MAATTFPIPLTTLFPGSQDFGPAAVPDGDTMIGLSIDRTVTGGLNSLTAATVLTIAAYLSNDGGGTWQPLASVSAPGGSIISKYTGQPETRLALDVTLVAGTSRQVRATVTVTGPSAVAVQGTITVQ